MSGVGLVTTDGMWGNETAYKYTNEEIKILGFTDKYYLPIARLWYNRLTALVRTNHIIHLMRTVACLGRKPCLTTYYVSL